LVIYVLAPVKQYDNCKLFIRKKISYDVVMYYSLLWFDTVGWATGRASNL